MADGIVTAKIHNNANASLMAGEALWNEEGCDWYIKTHVSDQGGTDATTGKAYEGVLICDNPDFQANWYVGSSDTSIKLYDFQWDGNIFTLEEVVIGDADEELIKSIDNMFTSIRNNYNKARTYAEYMHPDMLNCYSQSEGDEDYAALMAEMEELLTLAEPAYTEESLANLTSINQRLKKVIEGIHINQPNPGTFLRLRSAKTLGYVRSFDENSSGTDHECMSLSTEPDDYGIFFYDGEYLVNYLNGFYMDTNWLRMPGEVKSRMEFRSSPDGTMGAYYVVALDGSKGERNLMVNNSQNDILYRSNYSSDYNNFWLEYVTSVPVAIGENGWGSTYLPQTATLPEGLTAYTLRIENGKLLLSALGNLIPAAVPVLLQGQPGAYTLSLGYEEPYADCQLLGTYTTEYTTGNELIWNGETMQKCDAEAIWGFTAYMTADSGAEGLPSEIVTAIDLLKADGRQGTYKQVRDRRIVIVRNGRAYTTTGLLLP